MGLLFASLTEVFSLRSFQVVTLSVYTYFMAQLMGRQFVETTHPDGTVTGDPDIFFPLFTSLQVRHMVPLESGGKSVKMLK